MSTWTILEKRAQRLGALGTAFVYDSSPYGTGVYAAVTAERRYATFVTDGTGTPPREVGSLAVAERLVAILATPAGEALRADYARRARRNFIAAEIRRRGRILSLHAQALRRARTALAVGNAAMAADQHLRAERFANEATKITGQIAYQRALLDPVSRESLEHAEWKARSRERIATIRAAKATEAAARA